MLVFDTGSVPTLVKKEVFAVPALTANPSLDNLCVKK
jgi:hypothetical protein